MLPWLKRRESHTGVHIGFSRGDWEIGNGDEWWIECEITPDTLKQLAEEALAGRATGMQVGLHLENIYSDDDWAPPSVGTDWFLRPNRSDNTIKFPEMARGDITNLSFKLYSLTRPENVAATSVSDADEEAPIPAHDPTTLPNQRPLPDQLNLQSLTAAMLRLNQSVRWTGGAIALILLIFLFK